MIPVSTAYKENGNLPSCCANKLTNTKDKFAKSKLIPNTTKAFGDSTKNSTKGNLLDYTFLSHRSQLSSEKTRDVSKSKDYIFDLINTWELNTDLLENLLSANEQNKPLVEILQNIKTKFNQKKELRIKLSNAKGKILIEKQIIEELKRKCEENEEYYKDQLKELEENLVNKEEYIKIFEKKLKEVEIYIQKNTKNNPNSQFEPYKDFKIADFIEFNTDLMKKREVLTKELNEYARIKYGIEEENQNFKKDLNFSFNNEDEKVTSIYNNDICNIEGSAKDKAKEESKQRLKQLYDFYKNQIRVIDMRTKLLKTYFNQMSSNLKYFNFSELKKRYQKENKQSEIKFNNVDAEGEEIKQTGNNQLTTPTTPNLGTNADKSALNLDITRKMATFMDFSVVLNKKPADETNLDMFNKTGGLGNFATDNWDISCIGKN